MNSMAAGDARGGYEACRPPGSTLNDRGQSERSDLKARIENRAATAARLQPAQAPAPKC
jgi:hypothetical protein